MSPSGISKTDIWLSPLLLSSLQFHLEPIPLPHLLRFHRSIMSTPEFDVIFVGAGFGTICTLHR